MIGNCSRPFQRRAVWRRSVAPRRSGCNQRRRRRDREPGLRRQADLAAEARDTEGAIEADSSITIRQLHRADVPGVRMIARRTGGAPQGPDRAGSAQIDYTCAFRWRRSAKSPSQLLGSRSCCRHPLTRPPPRLPSKSREYRPVACPTMGQQARCCARGLAERVPALRATCRAAEVVSRDLSFPEEGHPGPPIRDLTAAG